MFDTLCLAKLKVLLKSYSKQQTFSFFIKLFVAVRQEKDSNKWRKRSVSLLIIQAKFMKKLNA